MKNTESIQNQSLAITPCLVAYFDRQDRAKHFTTPGFMARELASYYHTRQREMTREIVVIAVKVETLKNVRRRIKKLLKQAEQAQGDELRQIGAKIEALSKQVEAWPN